MIIGLCRESQVLLGTERKEQFVVHRPSISARRGTVWWVFARANVGPDTFCRGKNRGKSREAEESGKP